MNLIDTLTRAPTKTVVQSASQFGEKAAHVLGTYVDDSLKNISDDLTTTIDKISDKVIEKLGKSLDVFGVKLKETGVEGLTEVGIALERAFLHLGQKLETGVTNAGTRLAHGIDHSLSSGFHEIHTAVTDVSDDVSSGLSTIGNPQIEHAKKLFDKELGTIMNCLYLITATLCASGFLLVLYMTNALKLIFQFFPFFILLFFGVLNGMAIYKYKEPFMSGKKKEGKAEKNEKNDSSFSSNKTKTTGSSEKSALEEEKATEKENEKGKDKKDKEKQIFKMEDLKENIISVFDDKEKNIDTRLFLVLIIFSFITGNIAKEILIFTSINFFIQLLILIFITLLMYKSFCFQLFFKVYKFWKLMVEFYEWKTYKNGVINVSMPQVIQQPKKQSSSSKEHDKKSNGVFLSADSSNSSPSPSPFSPFSPSLEVIESEILNEKYEDVMKIKKVVPIQTNEVPLPPVAQDSPNSSKEASKIVQIEEKEVSSDMKTVLNDESGFYSTIDLNSNKHGEEAATQIEKLILTPVNSQIGKLDEENEDETEKIDNKKQDEAVDDVQIADA